MNTYYSDSRKAADMSLEDLADAVAADSNRGEWYKGKNSTNVYDWLVEGDVLSTDTVATLAQEWDE